MNNETQNILEQITLLKNELNELKGAFYKNNFSSSQVFTKDCNFSTKLKVPSYSTLPPCEPGEIGSVTAGGVTKLYICSATDTWTIVGTQT